MVIGMKTDSELFHILTQIQDEVHRYAITFHRDKRSKPALHSELDDIKGIGPKTKDALIKALKSVKRIREASLEQLQEIVGPAKAKVIFEHFEK
jgi:excinuclease ABC subunit C